MNQDHSETALMDRLHTLSSAGCGVIQIKTREITRAAHTLRKHLIGIPVPYYEWDVINGMRTFTLENFEDYRVAGEDLDFHQALLRPLHLLREPTSNVYVQADKTHYYVFVDPHPFIDNNPISTELLMQYASILPETNICVLLVTPDVSFDAFPLGTITTTDFPTPSAGEIIETVSRIVESSSADRTTFPDGTDVEEPDYREIARMGAGMTLHEVETHTALSVVEASVAGERSLTKERLLAGLASGKTSVVRQSEILELQTSVPLSDVGGMEVLKEWLAARSGCFSEDAAEFGIEAPKGVVLVGVPGAGKSLFAKATASSLGLPLVRLDFGRVFSRYIGDSESRVRAALKMIEAMSPVVLFVDEIDKGLSGSGGGGDSGTSARVLGTYLTWLQESTATVFNVVTANRVEGLPPELLRRGRFDQTFFAGLPTASERVEVLYIHLRKRGRTGRFTAEELKSFSEASEGYSPAEIESAVKDALIAAFNDPSASDVGMSHLLGALKQLVPLSRSNAAQIAAILQWGSSNAINVSRPIDTAAAGKAMAARLGTRTVRGRAQ